MEIKFNAIISNHGGIKTTADLGCKLTLEIGEDGISQAAQLFLFRGKALKVTIKDMTNEKEDDPLETTPEGEERFI